jgi:hypothetical protein
VITCNRCGSMSPASAMNCQNCGAPLSSNVETGLNPSRAFQEQPELPAWLESLRAGERPAAPADNPSSFSTADLIEEGSLPSWMRSGRPEMNDTGMSSPYPTLRPSSMSGPNTDDSQGINAKSLIDEQSLPSWMQENKQPTGSIPEGGIAASSLVQQDLMPDWMKSLQQNSSTANPMPSSAQPMSPPSPAFERPALTPRAESTNEISSRGAQGFSARDLVDQQSLPSWMTQQEGKGPTPARSTSDGTLSTSSLIDGDSLPLWLRESAQQGQRSGGVPPVQTNNPWQAPQPPMQAGPMPQSPFGQPVPPAMQPGSPVWQSASPQVSATPGINNASAQGGGLSASSFIDPNALPQWLRSGNEQQNQAAHAMPPQFPGANQRDGYNVPPRVENVRVPSRPRGEINSNEGNEAAANVFASMLGVASTAPNFPGPAQGYGMQGGQLGQGALVPPPSPMQNMPPTGNMPGQMAGANPGFNYPQGMQSTPQAQNYAPGGFNNGMYQMGNQGQGNYPAGNSFPGAQQYPPQNSGMPFTPNGTGNLGMETGGGQRTLPKPAKKRLFDMIRDWFR